jgi:hypothetical protein
MANWLEHYAEVMELNVWTSSTVISSTQDPITKLWSVTVKQQDGKDRVFKVKHVVLATGLKVMIGIFLHSPDRYEHAVFSFLLRLVNMDGDRKHLRAKYFILCSTARLPIMLGKKSLSLDPALQARCISLATYPLLRILKQNSS